MLQPDSVIHLSEDSSPSAVEVKPKKLKAKKEKKEKKAEPLDPEDLQGLPDEVGSGQVHGIGTACDRVKMLPAGEGCRGARRSGSGRPASS